MDDERLMALLAEPDYPQQLEFKKGVLRFLDVELTKEQELLAASFWGDPRPAKAYVTYSRGMRRTMQYLLDEWAYPLPPRTNALYERVKESGFFDKPAALHIPLHVQPGTHQLPELPKDLEGLK